VVRGPTAVAAGALAENLVLKAARAFAERVEGSKLGRFVLSKRLPVTAGLGGGSADAAAALRLLARENGIAGDDARLIAAARATGADVPVCLDPRPRSMRGIGDVLSPPVSLPRLPAVLLNPGVSVATRDVFLALRAPALDLARVSECLPSAGSEASVNSFRPAGGFSDWAARPVEARQGGRDDLIGFLSGETNDLERPAISLHPIIADALGALRAAAGCRLARMSGSGATCFGLFDTMRSATAAARSLRAHHPSWWIRATTLGG
jgi:4-diphosphocytidyl-2-C-methyl-D-erythritol kinase